MLSRVLAQVMLSEHNPQVTKNDDCEENEEEKRKGAKWEETKQINQKLSKLQERETNSIFQVPSPMNRPAQFIPRDISRVTTFKKRKEK